MIKHVDDTKYQHNIYIRLSKVRSKQVCEIELLIRVFGFIMYYYKKKMSFAN